MLGVLCNALCCILYNIALHCNYYTKRLLYITHSIRKQQYLHFMTQFSYLCLFVFTTLLCTSFLLNIKKMHDVGIFKKKKNNFK